MQAEFIRNRLLAVIAIILTIAAVKIGYPVLMPIVVSFCIIASAWPIKTWADRLGPPAVSYAATIIILIAGLLTFFGITAYALSQVVQNFAGREGEFRTLFESYSQWASENGLPSLPDGSSAFQRILSMIRAVLGDAYSVLSYTGIVAVIVILGFPEVPKLAHKFRHEYEFEDNRVMSRTVAEMAASLRRYLAMTTLASLITGVASFAWALVLGLDLAVIWGILNFLLNFIPVIGNIIGILPPTLYAFIQYGGWVMPLVVFSGFVVLQLFISNFVYPMLQSKGVSMPPITIILSLLFWGWIWGVAGGLLAVPLTAMIVIVCSRFEPTRRFAIFVGGHEDAGSTNKGEAPRG
ncbi:AI-2E family transporter [Fulvimarina sp. 2208YS6-2-32]|uniref:AI-2E family transporter n=2 Tax=Fulvimarina uroteuthidis TaxID=3098149 RepID=A0ABU5HYY5_9HYPH|nr:AI-2E family transporter [Fulvimarina sp. 2208YS6-2-32]